MEKSLLRVFALCILAIGGSLAFLDVEYEQVISERYLYSINRNQSSYWKVLNDVQSARQVCSLPVDHRQASEGVWLLLERENLFQMVYFSLNNATLVNITSISNETFFVTSNDRYTGALISLQNIRLIRCDEHNASDCSVVRTIPFSSRSMKILAGLFVTELQMLYFGTDCGLHRLNLNTFEITYQVNQINDSVSSLAVSRKYQTIFIGTETKLWMENYSQEKSQWRFEHVNGLIDAPITSLVYDDVQDQLWIGQNTGITLLSPKIFSTGRLVWYFSRLAGYQSDPGSYQGHLPFPNITTLTIGSSDHRIWLGSIYGLMRYDSNTTEWRVFNSARYMPMYSSVVNISSVAVLSKGSSAVAITSEGLAVLRFEMWTLEKKAAHFQNFIDKGNGHVRYNLVSDGGLSRRGDPSSCTKGPNDNDGLWTSMYLASQIFRYVLTNDTTIQRSAWDNFQALYSLHQITGIPGYPSRSLARTDEFPPQSGWFPSPFNSTLQFRGDTSSDEIVGHQFIYPLVYDYLSQSADQRAKALELLVNITDHILTHDWYLVGENHTHTTWGIWNPREINNASYYQETRGLNSLQILSFLFQTYSFTGDDRYLEGINQLIDQYQYDVNLVNQKMIAICDVSFSDDELEYLSYFNIIYAFHRIQNSTILSQRQKQPVQSLIDNLKEYIQIGMELSHRYKHKEKSPFYNFIYCYVMSSSDCDTLVKDGIWYMQRFPLELIDWPQYNSIRMDVQINTFATCSADEIFSRELLPPDERIVHKWNGSPFLLDQGDGYQEEDPTIFLISYWGMRFFH